VANQPGWYVLTLTDTTNHCVAIDSILLAQDISSPTAVIAPPDSLDCNNPQISLNGGGSGPSGILNYQWTTQAGNIVNGANTATPLVNEGGWYVLTLTRTDNGCKVQDSVLVYQDPNLPTVSIAPADTLTCDQITIQLTGSYQSPGTNLSFQWTTTNGQITGGGSTLVATINQPGTYTFTLLDNDTGCEALDEITVVNNLTVPSGMITPPDPLTCMDTLRIITLETNQTVLPLWRTISGQIIGGLDQMSMQTATPGQYEVVWTNPQNGCKDSLVITLGEDKQLPSADAGPDALLPCDPSSLLLDGTNSSGQGPLSYVWTPLQGQLVTTGNPGEAEVSSEGIYMLVVTDTENGCTATDTVTITQLIPMGLEFDLSPPGCKRAEGELSLLGSQGGQPPYLFEVDGSSYTQGTSLLLPPGLWPVSVVDDLGCRFDTVLTMPDRATLMLEAPPEVWITYGDSGRIELKSNFPSSAIDSVRWEPAIWLTPTADKLVWYSHATLAMQYQVWIRTEDGCEAKGLIQILIDNDPKIYVPNVFSPSDGNGINDRFYPQSKPGQIQKIQSMTIFDRWGNQVFRQDDFAPDDAASGWDGTHRGRLMQPAVLVWVMEVVLNTGEIVLLKGDVTIH
jgi:gliding motility-associated-like protein